MRVKVIQSSFALKVVDVVIGGTISASAVSLVLYCKLISIFIRVLTITWSCK